ncbi:MAG: hypothetical protein ACLFTG_11405 [Alphaproteobacteria bacterium]
MREVLASLETVAVDLASVVAQARRVEAERFAASAGTLVEGAPGESAIRGVALVAELRRPLPSPFTAAAPASTLGVWPAGGGERAFAAVFAWPAPAAARIRGYDL